MGHMAMSTLTSPNFATSSLGQLPLLSIAQVAASRIDPCASDSLNRRKSKEHADWELLTSVGQVSSVGFLAHILVSDDWFEWFVILGWGLSVE